MRIFKYSNEYEKNRQESNEDEDEDDKSHYHMEDFKIKVKQQREFPLASGGFESRLYNMLIFSLRQRSESNGG